jgi:hypothetical protein
LTAKENSKGERGQVCATKIKQQQKLFIENTLGEFVAQAIANDIELCLGHDGQRARNLRYDTAVENRG